MPKRADIESILIIGAGPIVIGQACEFDYAGSQACKALKEEGYRIILVNSNPATIMTDPEMADATYIEPMTQETLEKIIAKEKPSALLPTLGGQTALNICLNLAKAGILEKYNVELIGASTAAIHVAENRQAFRALMKEIGLSVPYATSVNHFLEAKALQDEITFPVIIRSGYSLGGKGAAIINSADEFIAYCHNAFAISSPQTLIIDEALLGWKEFELEVIRDKQDNCIVVCGVENVDPLGIHTGDSITVSPIQTLTDKEYQAMRQAAFAILRAVGVDTGGSNVQFAVNPQTGKLVVIEMNPRVSRSSALASKATGFPIAKVAAKLAVGYTLDELKNDITGSQLPASFEPSLDYVVVKIPRFDTEKFGGIAMRGPQMHSIGEVMAIGRTFAESLQKAMRSLEIGQDGFGNLYADEDKESLKKMLMNASPHQLWAIFAAMRKQVSITEIHALTHIDPWFLHHIHTIIAAEIEMESQKIDNLTSLQLKKYKRLGFADKRIASLLKCSVQQLPKLAPTFKRVDSCAGEFATPTAYLYSTYEQVCEAYPTQTKKMLIIGSGPNRIGQGIEFDYCCVHAALALRSAGYETIMVNCNPETVSTDYDVVDRLYCSPLTFEDVMAIINIEKPDGVFVQFGGQTSLKLATELAEAHVPLMGVDMTMIQQTENRQAFKEVLQTLNLQQPENVCVYSSNEACLAAEKLGYPLIIRPSFVLGGSAISVVYNETQLSDCLEKVFALYPPHKVSDTLTEPVLIETFLHDGIEVDVDVITDGKNIYIPGLLEHIEPAGIHSGDSACITPPVNISFALQNAIEQQVKKIANHLNIKGLFNVQFIIHHRELYVIEVNPRASRTIPILCKATGTPLIAMAINCILGKPLTPYQSRLGQSKQDFYWVKEAVLPFDKFLHANTLLGPEMKSTGEVMGIGKTPQEAYAKAQIAAGNPLAKSGVAYVVNDVDQNLTHRLTQLGFKLYCNDDFPPQQSELIFAFQSEQLARLAVNHKICYTTTKNAAYALVDAIDYNLNETYHVESLQKRYQQATVIPTVKHCLTGEEFKADEVKKILEDALRLKQKRQQLQFKSSQTNDEYPLAGYTLATLFDKPSFRTRMSFTIAMRELGGDVVESIGNTRKDETPEDYAGVLNGYCHGIMVRTHQDDMLVRMSRVSQIPIINGLTDLHHPCQIMADMLTLLETFGNLHGLTLSYVGDGNNILHSLLLLAPQLGVTIHYACPKTRGPNADILARALNRIESAKKPLTGHIKSFDKAEDAVKGSHAVYTDVWTSMGFEDSSQEDLFLGFQVNEALMNLAHPSAIFMHCLPMVRGKEVSHTIADEPCSVIYQQSENRLHVQKSLLIYLLTRGNIK